MSDERTNQLVELATEAYVYGFPLVFDLSMVEKCLHEGFGPVPAAPFNRFAHSDRLADADTRFVSVNNDTAYSLAQLDLSGGPLRLHVPDTDGAYYVLQFVDTWTNNFAYVGRRATGTEAGDWLVVPPGWAGTAPDDVRGVIDAPTAVVTVVGRNACDGSEDLERRVRPLQQQFTLTRLETGEHRSGLPVPDAGVPAELGFFERLRVWMADFPPSAADRAYQDRFQPLGLLEEGPSPYVPAGPDLVRALTEGMALGKERVEAASLPGAGAGAGSAGGGGGGWLMNPHLFDYNLDRFGVGTIDSPEWKIADRKASYLARAVAARVGLWGNHGYEAVYAQAFRDADGERLSGAYRYELRFEELPPVDAFWSLTMYDTPDYYLVANPAGRYSIGDRTPGIVYADDGSLTIHISKDRPADPAAAANWLPAPEGEFRPGFRLYMPKQAVLDGQYELPAVRRVGEAGEG